MNVGVILAAGRSSRFNDSSPKQLYPLHGKPIINYSIDVLSKNLDEVIIVSNSDFKSKIQTSKTILVNDVDDRLQSIKVALDYLKPLKPTNILIHDAARPYITNFTIQKLLHFHQGNFL